MKKWIIAFVMMPVVALAETTMRFEPREVALGESTRLIFETTQSIKKAPDFSSLKGNFAIGNQEQSSSTVVVNGRRSGENRIILTVFPRKEGVLTTGEVVFNGKKLEPVSVKVVPSSDANGLPVVFQASVNNDKPYVQGMVLYTIKLTDGAGLMGARMTNPEVEGARVLALNLDKAYQEMQNGSSVRVVERTFGIIPEKSGTITINPIEVYAAIPNPTRITPGDLFAQGMLFNGLNDIQKEVRLETNAIELKVQDKPATWVGWWLPSGDVKINVEDQIPNVVNVGDSITRVIQLSATGVEGSQLPKIDVPDVEGLKVYPSPDQRDTIQTEKGDILGTIKTSLVFVATQNGKITLPAVSVPWFNVKTGRTEFARLPQKVIDVKGEAPKKESPKKEVKADTPKAEPKPAADTPKEVIKTGVQLPLMIAITVGGVLVGFGLGFMIFHYRKKHKSYRLADHEKRQKKKKKILPDLYPM